MKLFTNGFKNAIRKKNKKIPEIYNNKNYMNMKK